MVGRERQMCRRDGAGDALRAGLVGAASAHVKIRVDGGEMSIQWRQEDGHVLMTGPTALGFIGEMEL